MSHYEDLTVLICTWNRASLLGETLDSIARVDIPEGLAWEVLVVDNNSTDATVDVVRARARAFPVPLRYVFEPRQGKSCAMNTGLETLRAPGLGLAAAAGNVAH